MFTTKIISLLVDPQTDFPAVTTIEHLEDVLLRNPEHSRIHKDSKKEDRDRQKKELVELLLSLGLVRRYKDSPKILVPLALRGRPDCWSKIIRTKRESAFILGLRLGVNPAVSVSASTFIQLMLDKCEDAERMWGCAFAYSVSVGALAPGADNIVFVRLSEDRRSADVVAIMDEDTQNFAAVQSEIESIAVLLGEGFNGQRDRMPLCPMCCSTDFFVRVGAAHAFHLQELVEGGVLICTRHHQVTAADCTRGKFTILDLDALPFVYPTKMHALELPWKCVAPGGIVSASDEALSIDSCSHAQSPPAFVTSSEPISNLFQSSSASSSPTPSPSSKDMSTESVFPESIDDAHQDGMFTDVSFFVLSGQVRVGDVIAPQSRLEFLKHMRLCLSQDCTCDVLLVNGDRKTLRFSFNVGETIPNDYVEGLVIQGIHPSDIGDRVLLPDAPRLQRFCAQDNVLVVFGPIAPKTKYLIFPGTQSKLNLVRITPALCKANSVAAGCWSELQVSISAT
jgi:hypothetical protein